MPMTGDNKRMRLLWRNIDNQKKIISYEVNIRKVEAEYGDLERHVRD